MQKLWEQYHATNDKRVRDRLVLSLAPMVKYIVYRKVREIPARCEVEDFISCGLEALMRSIDRYDPSRGATLEQFAWTRIHGAVLDELRRNDWAPRSLRRFERDFSSVRDRFVALHGRQPTRTELASALEMSEGDLERRMGDVQRSEVGSLNVLVMGEDDTTIERIDTLRSADSELDPERATMREHAKERFREAFDQLPERERQVAVLLYLHNLTLREIGDTLGVTESRVCQIHSQLRRRLREMLADHGQLFSEVA
ncbi:MAG TPA: FliA/WhiG family RNA polymerase sigma factor [Solirubrobacteraceae bacterium]|nr:FliA/WhiG family RNA polymerase sigma factor [Solirubrobacteraceae bacterium]